MSVKEAIRRWVDKEPEDSPALLALYEKLRADRAIPEPRKAAPARGVLSAEELENRWQEKRAGRETK